jgi:hypothetical protein
VLIIYNIYMYFLFLSTYVYLIIYILIRSNYHSRIFMVFYMSNYFDSFSLKLSILIYAHMLKRCSETSAMIFFTFFYALFYYFLFLYLYFTFTTLTFYYLSKFHFISPFFNTLLNYTLLLLSI